MLKTIARLEHKIGDKVYHLLCDSDSPISDVKEAISQFMGHVIGVENAVKAQAPQPVAEPVPVSEAAAPVETPPAEPSTQG
jgi:hypothetical protein